MKPERNRAVRCSAWLGVAGIGILAQQIVENVGKFLWLHAVCVGQSSLITRKSFGDTTRTTSGGVVWSKVPSNHPGSGTDLDNGKLLNVCPQDGVSAKEAAKGKAIGREMKVSGLWVKLDAKDRQTKREKAAAEIAHRLTVANHKDAARDKQRADEEQESGLRSAWAQSNGNCDTRIHSERLATPNIGLELPCGAAYLGPWQPSSVFLPMILNFLRHLATQKRLQIEIGPHLGFAQDVAAFPASRRLASR